MSGDAAKQQASSCVCMCCCCCAVAGGGWTTPLLATTSSGSRRYMWEGTCLHVFWVSALPCVLRHTTVWSHAARGVVLRHAVPCSDVGLCCFVQNHCRCGCLVRPTTTCCWTAGGQCSGGVVAVAVVGWDCERKLDVQQQSV